MMIKREKQKIERYQTVKKKGIIAKIDATKLLSSKAFMHLLLIGWILSMGALLAVSHYAEKDIMRQIERNGMEKGSVIGNR